MHLFVQVTCSLFLLTRESKTILMALNQLSGPIYLTILISIGDNFPPSVKIQVRPFVTLASQIHVAVLSNMFMNLIYSSSCIIKAKANHLFNFSIFLGRLSEGDFLHTTNLSSTNQLTLQLSSVSGGTKIKRCIRQFQGAKRHLTVTFTTITNQCIPLNVSLPLAPLPPIYQNKR